MSKPRFKLLGILLLLFFARTVQPEQLPGVVTVRVRFDHPQQAFLPVWNYFGYDEPNYTTLQMGENCLVKLLG